MNDFLKYQRTILMITVGLSVIVAVVLFLTSKDNTSIASGWILGAAAGIIVYKTRVNGIINLPNIPQDQWAKASLKSSAIIFAIIIAAMGLGALDEKKFLFGKDFFNVWAVLAGLLLERIVLRLDGWLRPGALAEPELSENENNNSENINKNTENLQGNASNEVNS
jgi:energy-converting hydrogenase Eha subunit A